MLSFVQNQYIAMHIRLSMPAKIKQLWTEHSSVEVRIVVSKP